MMRTINIMVCAYDVCFIYTLCFRVMSTLLCLICVSICACTTNSVVMQLINKAFLPKVNIYGQCRHPSLLPFGLVFDIFLFSSLRSSTCSGVEPLFVVRIEASAFAAANLFLSQLSFLRRQPLPMMYFAAQYSLNEGPKRSGTYCALVR